MRLRGFQFLIDNARWLSAGALMAFLSGFGQTYFISLFAGEIRSSFGLSHGQWGGVYTLGTTLSALVMVWAGALTDRYRARVLGAGTLLLLASACIMMAASTAWLLPIVIFALRFTGQGMMSHISAVSMSRWFVASRGRALSIAALGFSAGEAILPILFVGLLAFYDWRNLWVIAAIITLAGVPALMSLLRHERSPSYSAGLESAAGMGALHWTRTQTLRHPLFWLMVPALLGPAAFNTTFFFLQVHFAEIKGWAHLDLVRMFPLYTLVGIAAMMFTGGLIDRFGTSRLIPFFQLPMVAAFYLFSVANNQGTALIGLLFLGFTAGVNTTLPSAFWAEFYGTRHIGAIKSLAAAVMVFGSAIGPGITGVFLDLGIGIETQYFWVAWYFLFTTALMWLGVRRARASLPAAAKVDIVSP